MKFIKALAFFLCLNTPTFAADYVVFTQGVFSQTIPTVELREFVDTGDEDGVEAILSSVSASKLRELLSQGFTGLKPYHAYKSFNSKLGIHILGELFQSFQPFQGASETIRVTAMRGAIIKSLTDDRNATYMEIIENYGHKTVYISKL